MAIGTGDAVVKTGTQKTLEASGSSTVNGAYAQANDASYVRETDGSGAPDGVLVLSVTFGTAPSAGQIIKVYVRPLNIDSTNDAPIPDANFKHNHIGAFVVDAVTTLQYLHLKVIDLPADCDFYIYNGTGQTISAGWTLKITPETIGGAA